MDKRQNRPRFIEDISFNQKKRPTTISGLQNNLSNSSTYRPQTGSMPQNKNDNNFRNNSNGSGFLNSMNPNKPNLNSQPRRSQNQPTTLLNTTLPNSYFENRGDNGNGAGKKPKKHRWVKRHKILTSLAVVALLILGVGGWFGSSIIGNLDKVFHGNIFSDVHALFSSTTLRGEAQGRVNILLAGYQGKHSDEGALTDSIMVVSLDTKNNTGFTFSIPRDLLVRIPGMGYQKINAANTAKNFNESGYFKGGMGQLQQIIEQDFGIPIQYYALINYNAFEDAVNAVGGITIVIKSPDPRGLYDPNVDKAHGGPVRLPNGPVTLNGIHALALALARGDSPYAYGFPQSDINREQHQRQMLIALEQKAFSAGVLSNPIKVSNLFSAIGSNVKTDLTLADALKLVQLAKKVKISNIKSYGLSYGAGQLLTTYYSQSQGDSLIPAAGLNNYTQIQNFYDSITASKSN